MNKMQAHPHAVQEWSNKQGIDNLLDLWAAMPTKPDVCERVRELVSLCPRHDTIVDVGCGPGLKVDCLPPYRTYRGYDTASLFLAAAIDKHGQNEQRSFQLRSLFDGAPFKRPADVLLCIDVAQHYPDPLFVLQTVVTLWPARHYLFTLLHGPQEQELLNGYVVATAGLDGALAALGQVREQRDAPLVDFPPLVARYVVLDSR